MSIIERALGKLQKEGSGARSDTTQPIAARQSRAGGRVDQIEPAARTGRIAPPAETVTVNLEELRAAGALPREEFASTLTDQFRRIKWPILETVLAGHQNADDVANLIMVTSSIAGEGKTFMSLNLACSLAREKDFTVLLVDADVAKRHTTEIFRLQDRQGLTDAIADKNIDPESLVLGTTIPGLCVLPAGRRSSSAPELFASQRMSDIIQQLGRVDQHRIVLFDSSPLLLTNESQVLARLVDQVLFVVRAEFTAQPLVIEAIGLLDKKKPVRAVLNQARASRMTEYYYGYGYYPNDRQRQE
jgi:protein-tyrosine kinase